jgi:hypothetical protein
MRNALTGSSVDLRIHALKQHYRRRIQALRLLVGGADSGDYPKLNMVDLILELVRDKPGRDVRPVAIDLVQWTAIGKRQASLAPALVHESARIHERR